MRYRLALLLVLLLPSVPARADESAEAAWAALARGGGALMAIGVVEEFAPLSNLVGRYEAREEQLGALRPLVENWRGPGTLVLVSHGSVILPLTGVQPREGEIVVVEPHAGSPRGLRIVGRIPSP